MLVGLPGSGKSTFANEYYSSGYKIHSPKKIKLELYGDEARKDNTEEIYKELHKRIIEDIKNGFNIVYDDCNISSKKRRNFLNEIKKFNCKKICCFMASPLVNCFIGNSLKEEKISEDLIYKKYKNIKIPHYFEGWDIINLNFGTRPYINLLMSVAHLRDFLQNNPHHKLTLGNHMLKSAFECIKENDQVLLTSALCHDIGKIECKSFINTKGEKTENANYYGHENVGAYLSLFIDDNLTDKDRIERANIIQYHMMPYAWEETNNKKLRNKYERLWGTKLFEEIMIIHKADMEAH